MIVTTSYYKGFYVTFTLASKQIKFAKIATKNDSRWREVKLRQFYKSSSKQIYSESKEINILLKKLNIWYLCLTSSRMIWWSFCMGLIWCAKKKEQALSDEKQLGILLCNNNMQHAKLQALSENQLKKFFFYV